MGVVSRVGLALFGLVALAAGVIFAVVPGGSSAERWEGGLAAACVLVSAILLFRVKLEIAASGVTVTNFVTHIFVPASDFDCFVVGRWWWWPFTLYIQTAEGTRVHVFVRAGGLGSDPNVAKEEAERLTLTARALAEGR